MVYKTSRSWRSLGDQHVTGGQGLRLGKLAHDELADVAGLGEGRHRDLVLMGQRARHVRRAGRFAVAAARQDQQGQKRTQYPQETVLHQSSPPLGAADDVPATPDRLGERQAQAFGDGFQKVMAIFAIMHGHMQVAAGAAGKGLVKLPPEVFFPPRR